MALSLHGAFPLDLARRQVMEPDQTRAMGLDCPADRKASVRA